MRWVGTVGCLLQSSRIFPHRYMVKTSGLVGMVGSGQLLHQESACVKTSIQALRYELELEPSSLYFYFTLRMDY